MYVGLYFRFLRGVVGLYFCFLRGGGQRQIGARARESARERARDGESKGQVRREGDKQKDFVRNYTPRVSQREEEQKLNPTPWGSIQKQ